MTACANFTCWSKPSLTVFAVGPYVVEIRRRISACVSKSCTASFVNLAAVLLSEPCSSKRFAIWRVKSANTLSFPPPRIMAVTMRRDVVLLILGGLGFLYFLLSLGPMPTPGKWHTNVTVASATPGGESAGSVADSPNSGWFSDLDELVTEHSKPLSPPGVSASFSVCGRLRCRGLR